MAKELAIAIDGPAGAGKSTIARMLAKILNYIYIDTGAMYRAVTLKAIKEKIDFAEEEKLTVLAEKITLVLQPYQTEKGEYLNKVIMDGEDITEEIRTPLISQNVSLVAKVAGVREKMVEMQRKMADLGGTVMDGRDIGTVVLPQAELKIFLTASIEERADRRRKELTAKGYKIDLIALQKEMLLRDKIDSEREIGPLCKAEDAIVLDTTSLTIKQVVEKILLEYRLRKEGK